jgi:hypothetical protein
MVGAFGGLSALGAKNTVQGRSQWMQNITTGRAGRRIGGTITAILTIHRLPGQHVRFRRRPGPGQG